MNADYQAAASDATRLKAPRPYALALAHQHLPEMQAYTGLTAAPIFQPIVGRCYKGLAVTALPAAAAIHPPGLAGRCAEEFIADYYAGERFNVLPVNLATTTEGGFYNVEAKQQPPTGSIRRLRQR